MRTSKFAFAFGALLILASSGFPRPTSSLAQQDPTLLELVTMYPVPGGVRDVRVRGDYAYIAGGPGLVILDVSDPSAPSPVSSVTFPGFGLSLDVQGSYAYVADAAGAGGLRIFDVGEPFAAFEVGSFPAPGAWDLVALNDLVYLRVFNGDFLIIDVSNPASPSLVGSLPVGGGGGGALEIEGSLAYTTVGFGGVLIVDVQDPTSPVDIGAVPLVRLAGDLKIRGSTAYILSRGSILIADVADPQATTFVGSLEVGPVTERLAAFFPLAYIGGSHREGTTSFASVTMVDVSSASAPVEVAHYSVPGSVAGDTVSSGLDVVDDLIFTGYGDNLMILRRTGTPPSPTPTVTPTSTPTVTSTPSATPFSCTVNSILVDEGLSNNVVSGSSSGLSPCEAVLEIHNERGYWVNYAISETGGVEITPAGGASNLYDEFRILSPDESVHYLVEFSRPGQTVTAFLDVTAETGDGARIMNLVQAEVDLISLLVPGTGTLFKLAVEIYPDLRDTFGSLPHLEDASKALFNESPDLTTFIREIRLAAKAGELTRLGETLEELGFEGAAEAFKVFAKKPGEVLKILQIIKKNYGNVFSLLFEYPAGSVVFIAE